MQFRYYVIAENQNGQYLLFRATSLGDAGRYVAECENRRGWGRAYVVDRAELK